MLQGPLSNHRFVELRGGTHAPVCGHESREVVLMNFVKSHSSDWHARTFSVNDRLLELEATSVLGEIESLSALAFAFVVILRA